MQINGNEARQLEWNELLSPARCHDGEQLPDAGWGLEQVRRSSGRNNTYYDLSKST